LYDAPKKKKSGVVAGMKEGKGTKRNCAAWADAFCWHRPLKGDAVCRLARGEGSLSHQAGGGPRSAGGLKRKRGTPENYGALALPHEVQKKGGTMLETAHQGGGGETPNVGMVRDFWQHPLPWKKRKTPKVLSPFGVPEEGDDFFDERSEGRGMASQEGESLEIMCHETFYLGFEVGKERTPLRFGKEKKGGYATEREGMVCVWNSRHLRRGRGDVH